MSLVAGSAKDAEVWDALNQYPSTDGAKKLVLVRDAERIRNWKPLEPWFMSRQIPNVYALFVSALHDFPCKCKHAANRHRRKDGDRACRECSCQAYEQPEWLARIVKTGRTVKCGPLNEDDFITYLQGLGNISRVVGHYLYERVSGDLALASNCMRKARFYTREVSEVVVDRLTQPSPAESFVDELVMMRKARAADAIWAIPEDDYRRIIGLLDHDVEVLARLHRLQTRRLNPWEIEKESKEHRMTVQRLLPAARHYDPVRVRNCINTLAFVDSALGRGAREGVLEALVAIW